MRKIIRSSVTECMMTFVDSYLARNGGEFDKFEAYFCVAKELACGEDFVNKSWHL